MSRPRNTSMNIAAPTDVQFVTPRRIGAFARLEAIVCNVALAAMVVLPISDLIVRAVFRVGIPGAVDLTQHLSLWIGFCGAIVAARQGRHLSLAGNAKTAAHWLTNAVSA